MSEPNNKRARRQALESDLLDEGIRTLSNGVAEAEKDFTDAALLKLQRQVNSEELVSKVIPYSMWSPELRKNNEKFISHVATLIEKRSVVPDDRALHERLRRAEAARAPERGAASVALYDAVRPDPSYAHKRLGVGDVAQRRIGGPIDHGHRKETTRIGEMRTLNELDNTLPLPADIVDTERFCDACIPVDCQTALHSLSTYDQALRFASKISLGDKKKKLQNAATNTGSLTTHTLASFVKTIQNECAMPIFCVRFLCDTTIEVCAHMETNACYFAIFAFSIAEHVCEMAKTQRVSEERALEILRARVCAEVSKEREISEKRLSETAQLLQAPSHSLSKEQISERAKMISDEREFRALADKFHLTFEPNATDKDEAAISRYCKLAVFAPNKSPLLLSLACSYLYTYFATCQCLMDLPDEKDPVEATRSNKGRSGGAEVRLRSETSMVDGMALTSSIGFNFNETLDRVRK